MVLLLDKDRDGKADEDRTVATWTERSEQQVDFGLVPLLELLLEHLGLAIQRLLGHDVELVFKLLSLGQRVGSGGIRRSQALLSAGQGHVAFALGILGSRQRRL